jgi:hypothetical protein
LISRTTARERFFHEAKDFVELNLHLRDALKLYALLALQLDQPSAQAHDFRAKLAIGSGNRAITRAR